MVDNRALLESGRGRLSEVYNQLQDSLKHEYGDESFAAKLLCDAYTGMINDQTKQAALALACAFINESLPSTGRLIYLNDAGGLEFAPWLGQGERKLVAELMGY